jgi:hypothetical protein
MPKLTFNPEVNYGHILTFLSVTAAAMASLFLWVSTVNQQGLRIDRLELDVAAITADRAAQQERSIAQQIELTRTLTQMQADLAYLRANVERMPHLTPGGGQP